MTARQDELDAIKDAFERAYADFRIDPSDPQKRLRFSEFITRWHKDMKATIDRYTTEDCDATI